MIENVFWCIKSFQQLLVDELYQILQLRSEVFVVEQNCVFQDMDGKDAIALHLFGVIDNQIVAYTRLFKPGQYYDLASIGRVVVSPKYRALKLGHLLMKVSIDAIKTEFNQTQIKIGAQVYLQKFYESHRFQICGEVYLEDDIEHVIMQKN